LANLYPEYNAVPPAAKAAVPAATVPAPMPAAAVPALVAALPSILPTPDSAAPPNFHTPRPASVPPAILSRSLLPTDDNIVFSVENAWLSLSGNVSSVFVAASSGFVAFPSVLLNGLLGPSSKVKVVY